MRPLIRRRQRSDITFQLPGVIVHTRVALAGVCPLRMTFILMLSWTMLLGQEIRVGVPSLVARAPEHRSFTEPILTVHPVHPDYLLAAAMIEAEGASFEERVAQQTCATFLSLDAGRTWRQRNFSVTRCFDPWVAVTPDGRAFLSVIGRRSTGEDGLFIFHSPDGGQTWDDTPINVGGGFDHPTLMVDYQSQKRKGWIYLLSWQPIRAEDGGRRSALTVMRSLDSGKTFPDPTQVIPNNLVNLAEMPVVLSDGTLIVSFVEAARWADTQGRLDRFDRWRAWVLRSTDGGHAFSIPLFVTDACGPPPAFQLSALAVDTSTGPFRDRLYFLCGARERGPITLTFSADRGETWSTPVAVPPALHDSEPRRVLGLAVNNKGVLAIVHLDHIAQSGDSCQELYFVASLDGGLTFLPPRRVSSAPCAAFGDYFGMITTPDGRFHLVWPEVHGGVSELRTMIVEVEGHGAPAR